MFAALVNLHSRRDPTLSAPYLRHQTRLLAVSCLVAVLTAFLWIAVPARASTTSFVLTVDIADTIDTNTGYRGTNGSASDGWRLSVAAWYVNPNDPHDTVMRGLNVFSDGSWSADSYITMTLIAPLDNPDLICNSQYWFDRYQVYGLAQNTIQVNGRTYNWNHFNYYVNITECSVAYKSSGDCTPRYYSSCSNCYVRNDTTGSATAVIYTTQ